MKLDACEMKPVPSKPVFGNYYDVMRPGFIDMATYRDKLAGCFMGKSIGGTAGAPLEWKRQINDFTFYQQELGGNPLPNDDLDIQLLWLVALEERGINIDSRTLAEYWLTFVTPHWSEYGTAKINMRAGLLPPVSGTHQNEYKDSCGAYIRSEIWACIAPGAPYIATKYAYEDAALDHGDGEGTYATVFIAALESAAFVESDIGKLIDIALGYIPADCVTAQAVRFVRESFLAGEDYVAVRDELLRRYRGCVSGACPEMSCRAEYDKGLFDGKLGFDVPTNLAIVIMGLQWGGDDFGRVMRVTINCGEDTDCTAATAGAVFGLIHGIGAIPEKWIAPIGNGIVTACLNLGELGGYGAEIPATVDELVNRVTCIGQIIGLSYVDGLEIANGEPSKKEIARPLECQMPGVFTQRAKGPVFSFDFFDIQLVYEGGPAIRNGEEKKVVLRVVNKYKATDTVDIRVWADDELTVAPSRSGRLLVKASYFRGKTFRGCVEEAPFTFICDYVNKPRYDGVFQLTVPGRCTNMTVPFTLTNGNFIHDDVDYYYTFTEEDVQGIE